jgi:regulator of protease activity HflC (stomatin/prohibitin superfamily)
MNPALVTIVLIIVITIIVFFLLSKSGIRIITIYDWEKGILLKNGKYIRTINSGTYWINNYFTTIQKIDTRPRYVSIPGQEVLSADSVSLKVSIVTQYQVENVYSAVSNSTNYEEFLYTCLQIGLREIIGNTAIDDLLEKRNEFSKKLYELTNQKVSESGLKLLSADIKDIMFPGELKKMFAQIVKAKKEGLATLERARGETAALRNLSNAAKMIDENPNLLQLRMLQALSESTGNTIVFNAGTSSQVIPVKSGQNNKTDQ